MIQFTMTCKGCRTVASWQGETFREAAARMPQGWTYSDTIQGAVCPSCKGGV